jgi:hypothetical protein
MMQSPAPGVPYVGCRISLISKADIRYEGTLQAIDYNESTITVQNGKWMLCFRMVRFEGRIR